MSRSTFLFSKLFCISFLNCSVYNYKSDIVFLVVIFTRCSDSLEFPSLAHRGMLQCSADGLLFVLTYYTLNFSLIEYLYTETQHLYLKGKLTLIFSITPNMFYNLLYTIVRFMIYKNEKCQRQRVEMFFYIYIIT